MVSTICLQAHCKGPHPYTVPFHLLFFSNVRSFGLHPTLRTLNLAACSTFFFLYAFKLKTYLDHLHVFSSAPLGDTLTQIHLSVSHQLCIVEIQGILFSLGTPLQYTCLYAELCSSCAIFQTS